MQIYANTLKAKNVMLMIMCAMIVPVARVIVRHTAESSGAAAWLCPILAVVLFIPYAAVLISIIKNNDGKCLAEINELILGKVLGKTVNIIYFVWLIMLAGYYLCQFSERMAITVFSNTNSAAFIALMLIVLSYSLGKGEETVIRTASVFFYSVISIVVLSLLLLSVSVNFEYYLPVSLNDASGVIKGAFQIFSVMTYYITLPFFLNDVKVTNIKKDIALSSTVMSVLSFFTIAVIIGIFSAPVAAEMPFPYYAAIKEIKLFDSVERLEAVILSIMIFSDFVAVALFVLCAGRAIKTTFGLKNNIDFDMLLVIVFTVSLIFSANSMRLNEISSVLIVPVNLIVGGCLPFLVWAIMKLKRKVKTP